ncbi:MAG TPA: rhodanese-like domain-containing protein [Thermoanaerobaculia bacterium]|nr:rhodanese-like domain-containing protein [Thermoanaerobaculia bacterium]
MVKTTKPSTTSRPASSRKISQGTGFVLGTLAGVAIVAAIWFAYTAGKESAAAPAVAPPSASAPAAQPAATDAPPPPPAITDAEAHSADRISVAEAKQLIDAGGAAVIDVRDPQSYAAGHIPGALQIPLAYVQGELPWFPRDKKLIFYCT